MVSLCARVGEQINLNMKSVRNNGQLEAITGNVSQNMSLLGLGSIFTGCTL